MAAAARAGQQQLHPTQGASWKLHSQHALEQPLPVQAVVRLGEVQEQDAPGPLLLAEIVNLLEVQ
jgi:hypothetical protein